MSEKLLLSWDQLECMWVRRDSWEGSLVPQTCSLAVSRWNHYPKSDLCGTQNLPHHLLQKCRSSISRWLCSRAMDVWKKMEYPFLTHYLVLPGEALEHEDDMAGIRHPQQPVGSPSRKSEIPGHSTEASGAD